MTPEQASGAVQFIADQQGQFANEMLRMQNRLEQSDTLLKRVEDRLRQAGEGWQQAAGDLKRMEAILRELQEGQARTHQELATLRAAVVKPAR
ncbi:MAG: hypothetical protein ACRD2H_03905 [Terriglobales bacterium]